MNAEIKQFVMAASDAPAQPLADIHDRVTEAYYGKMGHQFMRETQERIHWICRNVQGKRVLDVGCSQGIVPILLAREGIDVIGIDTSHGAIEEATLYMASEPSHVRDKIEFVNADFLTHEFQELKVETIVISEVLEHLVQPQSFIDAAAKLLPTDGRLVITVPFGINDFIDHKHTFYLLEPYRLIAQRFEVKEIAVLGKWLGIVASPRKVAKSKTVAATLSAEQIEQLEAAFFQIERNLRDDLVTTRKKLDDANQKYRAVSEQIAVHKQRVSQEEAARVAVDGKLQQAVAQFTQTKERLDDANQKYREATEQVSTLKQRVAQEETTRFATVKELEQTQAQLSDAKTRLQEGRAALQEERTALQQKIEQLQAQGHSDSAAAHEVEKQLIGLQAKFEATQGRLDDANQKYRDASEQVSGLKQRVVQEETTRVATVKELEQTQAQLSDARARQQEERTALQEERTALQQKI
jgi:ubiquinone/menaquinone biosynthesis C-methylase UbiE